MQKAARKSRKKRMEGMEQLKAEVERLEMALAKANIDHGSLQLAAEGFEGTKELRRLELAVEQVRLAPIWSWKDIQQYMKVKAVLFILREKKKTLLKK